MSVPTAFQLARLRQRPQETILHLAIYEPQILLQAQINNPSIAKGAIAIPYDNATIELGGYPRNAILYVGSTPGGWDKGRVRVRGSTGSTIGVGRNDHIKWEDNLYITLVDFIEPCGIFHRITLSGDVPTFFRDYDITYTDQNRLMPPVVCMTHHRTVFAGDQITWDASESFSPIGANIVSYLWAFSGASTPVAASSQVTVTYPTPGNYKATCTVTDSNGKSFTGTRYVKVLHNAQDGVRGWGIESMNGSRDQSGWAVNLWLRSGDLAVRPGSLVMIIAEDWFNNEKLAIPNNNVFVGYVEDESLSFDWKTNKVSFTALSITGICGSRETYGVALDSVASGAEGNWTQMANITTDKALINYLMFNTTLLDIADFHPTGDARKKKFADLPHGPIQDTVRSFLQANLLAEFVADRDGDMWCEINLNYVPIGSRNAPVNMQMEKKDWRGEPEIQRNLTPETSYVELGGVHYTGVADQYTAYLSGAPGDVPGYSGRPENITGLTLTSQAQLNQLAGDVFAEAVSEFPRINFPMAGHYRNIDIAPQERVAVDLDPADNHLGLHWDGKLFIPNEISYEYNASSHVLFAEIGMKEETSGFLGDTIIIPVDPPDGAEDPNPGDPIGLPLPPTPGSAQTVYACYGEYLFRTRDFQSTPPTWEVVCTATSLGMTQMRGMIFDPFNPRNSAWIFGDQTGVGASMLVHTTNLDDTSPTWITRWTKAIGVGMVGTNVNNITALHANSQQQGRIYFGADSDGSSGRVFTSSNYGLTWSMGQSLGAGPGAGIGFIEASDRVLGKLWIGAGRGDVWRSLNHGSSITRIYDDGSAGDQIGSIQQLFVPHGGNDNELTMFLVSGNQSVDTGRGRVLKSTNGGSSFSDISPSNGGTKQGGFPMHNGLTGDLNNGLNLIAAGTNIDNPRNYNSLDGSTWVERFQHTGLANNYAALGTWPYNHDELFLLTNDSGGPIYSLDGGFTWNGKEGNIPTLAGGAVSNAGSPIMLIPVWI